MATGRKNKSVSYARYGYLFILPFFLVYIVFQAYPLINTFYLAFQKYMLTGAGKWVGPKFVGLDNFKNVLTKGYAIRALSNTSIMWIINFIPQIFLALLLAKWFTDTVCVLGSGAYKGTGIYVEYNNCSQYFRALLFSYAYPQDLNSLLATPG